MFDQVSKILFSVVVRFIVDIIKFFFGYCLNVWTYNVLRYAYRYGGGISVLSDFAAKLLPVYNGARNSYKELLIYFVQFFDLNETETETYKKKLKIILK